MTVSSQKVQSSRRTPELGKGSSYAISFDSLGVRVEYGKYSIVVDVNGVRRRRRDSS